MPSHQASICYWKDISVWDCVQLYKINVSPAFARHLVAPCVKCKVRALSGYLFTNKSEPDIITVHYISTSVQQHTSASVQCISTVHQYSASVQCISTVHQYSASVQCTSTVHQYSASVVHQYSASVQCISTVHQYSASVQCRASQSGDTNGRFQAGGACRGLRAPFRHLP
jgi:hypothetical protein